MNLTKPTNAEELTNHLMEGFITLKAGGMSPENAMAMVAFARETNNLIKNEILVSKFYGIDAEFSPARKFYGYGNKQIKNGK